MGSGEHVGVEAGSGALVVLVAVADDDGQIHTYILYFSYGHVLCELAGELGCEELTVVVDALAGLELSYVHELEGKLLALKCGDSFKSGEFIDRAIDEDSGKRGNDFGL